MLLARQPRPPRAFFAAVAAVVGASVVGWPTAAGADDPVSTGDTVVGELVQAWTEHEGHESPDGGHGGPVTWIETGGGESVRVSTEQLIDLVVAADGEVPVGATVEVVVGDEVVDGASIEEGLQPAYDVLDAEVLEAAPEDETLGAAVTNEVTVVMVVPPGGAAETGRTLQQVVDAVNGPVATYWNQQTGGAVTVAAAAQNVDWMQGTVPCSDPVGLWNEAATKASWTGGPGKHLLVYLPHYSSGCSYGLAQIGAGPGAGGRLYVTDIATSVVAHELGHNFSLGHSSGRQCDRGTESGDCRDVEYRDYYDVMGVSGPWIGSLNAPQADRLGVLPADQRVSLTAPVTGAVHTLRPYAGGAGIRAIRLTSGTGAVYWLEYRTAIGQDGWLATSTNVFGLQQGVMVRRAGSMPRASVLLDGTASDASRWNEDWQVTLPVGRSVDIAGTTFSVTVESSGPDGARVWISQGGTVSSSAGAIGERYLRSGGPDGPLGDPVSDERCSPPDGGCARSYTEGGIYWSSATGARLVQDPVLAHWTARGGVGGIGYPVSDTTCGLRSGGCYQLFQRGAIYASSDSAPAIVLGGIRARWQASGAEWGVLGYPTAGERCALSGGGCSQTFAGGLVVWSPVAGAKVVHQRIADHWSASGGVAGIGYPVSDTTCGLRSGGCYQLFQRGAIYASSGTAPAVVLGAIRQRWQAGGAEWSSLGYPLEEERPVTGGAQQRFEGGTLFWSAADGVVRQR